MTRPGRAAALLLLGLAMPGAPACAARSQDGIRPLLGLLDTIQANYAGEGTVTRGELMKDALEGMVASLDPYSEFLDQQKYADLQEDTRGSFGGVGIEIGYLSGRLSVIAPIEGTPADRAGLQGGDIIAFINGTPTDDMKILDAVHRIKGPPGTTVTLTVEREGVPLRDYPLIRGEIRPVNIRDTVVDGIGYVTIRSFSEQTTDNLEASLKRFQAARLPAVILDLRGNPGGLLQEAYKVCELFLEEGSPIVSTEGRDPQQTARFYSRRRDPYRMPLVVLTNEHSASGSEIVAGALKDSGRAVLMGRRSFGKASVQAITPVTRDRGQAVRLTVAHYYTPRHHEIHEVGIEPDVTLPPLRFPAGLRRLFEESAFNRYATEVLPLSAGRPGSTAWLDATAFAAGRMEPVRKDAPAGAVDERMLPEFRRWLDEHGLVQTDESWEALSAACAEQLRLAVMRRAKGEEAVRKLAIEFDPQVKAAVALLKLAGRATPAGAWPAPRPLSGANRSKPAD